MSTGMLLPICDEILKMLRRLYAMEHGVAPEPRWRRPQHGRARSAGAASSARERVFLGEQRPIAIKRPRIKEADPAVIGLECATRNTALIAQMKEIGANLLLTEHIGRAHVVGREPADCLDVDVPGPLSKTGKPHVVDHTLTQRGHGRSPFEFRHQELGPGTRADTPARSPQRLHPPTAKPFSPTAAA